MNQSVVAPVTAYAGNSSVVKPTGNSTISSSLKTTTAAVTSAIATAGSGFGSGSNSSSTRTAAAATQTGSATNVGASLVGLVIAAGVAVLAL